LAAERGIDVNNPSNIDADGYPLGFGNNQAVCPLLWLPIPVMRRGFYGILEAYLSNWAVKYNGLMRYDLFKGILNDFLCNITTGLLIP
jgi:hypothetical protein